MVVCIFFFFFFLIFSLFCEFDDICVMIYIVGPCIAVVGDASLQEFLDSYLQFRSRWYDFPRHGSKGMVAGLIVGELELSRRVFMLLYRL